MAVTIEAIGLVHGRTRMKEIARRRNRDNNIDRPHVSSEMWLDHGHGEIDFFLCQFMMSQACFRK